MSKADVIEVEGTVVEKLPNAFFKVELEIGRAQRLNSSHPSSSRMPSSA